MTRLSEPPARLPGYPAPPGRGCRTPATGLRVAALLVSFFLSLSAPAQPGADGIDWVTIGAPGNAPYTGFSDPLSPTYGRGGVDYEFRIGRYELTTAQALEFFNAALARPDPLPFSVRWWTPPVFWGASIDPNYQGPGVRYRLNPNIPDAGMLPVGGITWRTAAVMANWLHNDKATDQSAFMNGAYDTSTFTPNFAFPTFNDQAAHSPGARYWIPTLDEWIKAVHYDPHANDGAGRWWEQPNMSDIPLVYAPPPSFGGDGTGQANAGFELPNNAERLIPLGAYPDVQSPWGLLDAAGGTAEWVEEIRITAGPEMRRGVEGSRRSSGSGTYDLVYRWGSESPHFTNPLFGVRLASVVPSPGVLLVMCACSYAFLSERRRSAHATASVPTRVRDRRGVPGFLVQRHQLPDPRLRGDQLHTDMD